MRGQIVAKATILLVPPHERSAGLHSFNMDANWFQKERLNYE
jgi:hypothetical protein